MSELIAYDEAANRILLKCRECESKLRIEYQPLGENSAVLIASQ
ncbi:hypothetical protein PQO03_00770 [Lentisphaera profundi]|uniref:Uncharacterized protein n=1 Tax=Lentisphaera profundi TaxID=1658616 RepID=A0ABY7VR50_9BACT|nr:hypothetical protein [Lentisphaera profundi]WDE96497.1 hypothetical protein PQO03_00770 [Lentisphaera profundi]